MLDIIRAIEVLSKLLENTRYLGDDVLHELIYTKLTLCLNAIKEIPY